MENFELEPQSLVREDDVEVYLRSVCYRNKVGRLSDKYLSRLKWLPMQHRYSIFEGAIEMSQRIKTENVAAQKLMHKRVKENTLRSNLRSPELETEVQQVLDSYYCERYDQFFVSNMERVKHSWKGNHDTVPELIADIALLKARVQDKAKYFGLCGDIELDQGFSFCY